MVWLDIITVFDGIKVGGIAEVVLLMFMHALIPVSSPGTTQEDEDPQKKYRLTSSFQAESQQRLSSDYVCR